MVCAHCSVVAQKKSRQDCHKQTEPNKGPYYGVCLAEELFLDNDYNDDDHAAYSLRQWIPPRDSCPRPRLRIRKVRLSPRSSFTDTNHVPFFAKDLAPWSAAMSQHPETPTPATTREYLFLTLNFLFLALPVDVEKNALALHRSTFALERPLAQAVDLRTCCCLSLRALPRRSIIVLAAIFVTRENTNAQRSSNTS